MTKTIHVFLAGIIQGSKVEAAIHSQDWRQCLRRSLERYVPGVDIHCQYSLHPNSITYDLPEIRRTIEEGNRKAADCDALVAFLPTASMGTAIEMYEAYRSGAVVLAVTPLAANWVIRAYSHRILPDMAAFETFLAEGGLQDLIKGRG